MLTNSLMNFVILSIISKCVVIYANKFSIFICVSYQIKSFINKQNKWMMHLGSNKMFSPNYNLFVKGLRHSFSLFLYFTFSYVDLISCSYYCLLYLLSVVICISMSMVADGLRNMSLWINLKCPLRHIILLSLHSHLPKPNLNTLKT